MMRNNKYGARKTVIDGIAFASALESRAYLLLKARQHAGEISNLRLQVPYKLEIGKALICKYVADFVYLDHATNQEVVADAKGMKTPIYNLKKKLMKALLGIEITELSQKPKTKKPRKK